MVNKLIMLAGMLMLLSCGHSYYVVRHAEKAQPSGQVEMSSASNNPPLSEAGKQRAQALSDVLKNKKIRHIFSTNTIRTLSTAEPLGNRMGVKPVIYSSVPSLITTLKTLKNKTLVVGHSNTIDDIVNGLTNEIKVKGDLGDEEYDHLYVVKLRGKKARFKSLRYGSGE